MSLASGSTLLATLRDLDSLFTCLNQVTELRNCIPGEVNSIRNAAASEQDERNRYYYQGLIDCYTEMFKHLTTIVELADPEAFNDTDQGGQQEDENQEQE